MYKLLILVYITYAAALESRIVNGRDARRGEIGYIVSLQKHHHHVCGGSIINEYNVITAAHCIVGFIEQYQIQYGVLKIVPNDVNVIQVREGFLYEYFTPSNYLFYDIAVLRLSSPLPFNSSKVRPIPLPTQGEEFRTNTWARLAGWGSVDKTMMVYLLPLQTCKKPHEGHFRKDEHLCAGYIRGDADVRKGPCSGDAGSPLAQIVTREHKLAGLYSGGWRPDGICGNYPEIFTKVSYYVTWIEEQLYKV